MSDEREDDPAFVKYWLRMGASREQIEQVAADVLNRSFATTVGKSSMSDMEKVQRERISREQALMATAQTWAQRSTCLRLQVGAIVHREGRILVCGYNGAAAGTAHCHADHCGPEKGPCLRCVHAEANCIAFAAKHGIALDRTSMYCTDSPCMDCAKLIINAGIREVVFLREYRDSSPLRYLSDAGVQYFIYA